MLSNTEALQQANKNCCYMKYLPHVEAKLSL